MLMLLLLLTPSMGGHASAESGRVTFNDPTVQLGNAAPVYMSIFKGGRYLNNNVASVDITLNYDPEYLQFITASNGMGNLSTSSSGPGTLRVTDRVNSGTSSFSCELRFNTLKAGTTKISVKSVSVLDRNGSRFSMTSGVATVVINDDISGALLKALEVKDLELYPTFESRTLNYAAYAPYEMETADIKITPADAGSNYRMSGDTQLSVGENDYRIVVTGGGGSSTTYNLTIIRMDEGEAIPDEPPQVEQGQTSTATQGNYSQVLDTNGEAILMMDREEKALSVMNFTDDEIPVGFTRSSFEYKGAVIPCCVYSNSDSVKRVVYLMRQGLQTPPSFYYYNPDTEQCSAMATIQGGSYIIVDMLSTYSCPEYYRDGTYLIGGTSYQVFTPKDVDIPNHYLVSAINSTGLYGLYVYDVSEGTLQRFNFMELAASEVLEPTDGEGEGEDGDGNKETDTTFKGIASLLRAIGTLDDDRRLSRFITSLFMMIFVLMLVVAGLAYYISQIHQKRRRELKFNVPPISVHAEAVQREAEQNRIIRREERKARRLKKKEERLQKKLKKQQPAMGVEDPPEETAEETAPPEEEEKIYPGVVEDGSALGVQVNLQDLRDMRINLDESEGSLEYDRELERMLREMGIGKD